MKVDDNPQEIAAMELFKKGDNLNANKVQNEFVQQVFSCGEDHCSCPVACRWHGKCAECVVIHRGHGDHIPYCMQAMINRKLCALAELTEQTLSPR